MARDDDDNEEASFKKHPALKNFNRTGFIMKHVLFGLLKGAAIGAVAGIGAAIAMSFMTLAAGGWVTGLVVGLGALLRNVPIVGDLIGAGAGEVGGFALQAGGVLALSGAGIGAAVMGIMSMSSASAAADAEEDKLVAKYEQQQARKERMVALEQRRDQQRAAMEQQAAGVRSPNMQIPYGRQQRQQGPGMATT